MNVRVTMAGAAVVIFVTTPWAHTAAFAWKDSVSMLIKRHAKVFINVVFKLEMPFSENKSQLNC